MGSSAVDRYATCGHDGTLSLSAAEIAKYFGIEVEGLTVAYLTHVFHQDSGGRLVVPDGLPGKATYVIRHCEVFEAYYDTGDSDNDTSSDSDSDSDNDTSSASDSGSDNETSSDSDPSPYWKRGQGIKGKVRQGGPIRYEDRAMEERYRYCTC